VVKRRIPMETVRTQYQCDVCERVKLSEGTTLPPRWQRVNLVQTFADGVGDVAHHSLACSTRCAKRLVLGWLTEPKPTVAPFDAFLEAECEPSRQTLAQEAGPTSAAKRSR
jgi:hypothetical protein